MKENSSTKTHDRAPLLSQCVRMANYTVAVILFLGALFVAVRVVTAFSSGRVNQILHNAHCAQCTLSNEGEGD